MDHKLRLSIFAAKRSVVFRFTAGFSYQSRVHVLLRVHMILREVGIFLLLGHFVKYGQYLGD